MEMKTRTVRGGVCYHSRLAGINGGQFRSQKLETRNEKSDTEIRGERKPAELGAETQKTDYTREVETSRAAS
jgi:hypothetical protein